MRNEECRVFSEREEEVTLTLEADILTLIEWASDISLLPLTIKAPEFLSICQKLKTDKCLTLDNGEETKYDRMMKDDVMNYNIYILLLNYKKLEMILCQITRACLWAHPHKFIKHARVRTIGFEKNTIELSKINVVFGAINF